MVLFRWFLFLLPVVSFAQPVPRALLVEHFANTVCSICANRNPGLHQMQYANELAFSIHTSSRFCRLFLSQYSLAAKDERTNFQPIYEGTSCLVINGVVRPPGGNIYSVKIFQPFQGQFLAFAMNAFVILENGQVRTQAVTKKIDSDTSDDLWLFHGLAEGTIRMNTRNGESTHYRVVRKAMLEKVPLPLSTGESVVVVQVWPLHAVFDLSRLFQLAVLSDVIRVVEKAVFSA